MTGTFLFAHGESVQTGVVAGEYSYPAVSLGFEISFLGAPLSMDFRGTVAESGQTIIGTVFVGDDGQRWPSVVELRRES